MPRFEKCDHCRYGWNKPRGCNYPEPLDPCRIDMSCYQPMTEAQKFQQKAERECKSDKTNHTKLVGDIFSGYDIIDTTNPMEMANYYASELVKKITNASVKQRDDLGFTMWVDDFANRILGGLTTDYVLYEFLRRYRAYLVSEITCDYFKKAQA